jgi:hypothetical protein
MALYEKLKFKYKISRIMVFLFTVTSLFAFGLSKGFGLLIILVDYFEVNYDECAKCQENGMAIAIIGIMMCVLIVLISFIMASAVTALVLSKIDGTGFKYNFQILFNDKIPSKWFKD